MSVKKISAQSGIFRQERIEVTIEEHSQEYDNQAVKKSLLNIGLEPLLEAYERRAIDILSEMGYPLTLDELWPLEAEEIPSRVHDIKTFLSRASNIRDHIREGNSSDAAWNAFLAAQSAMRAEIRPYEHDLIREVTKNKPARSAGGLAKKEAQSKKLARRNNSWRRRAKELHQTNSHMTDESAAAIIRREALQRGTKGCSLRNIQRVIKNKR
jgi:hypothetical protein